MVCCLFTVVLAVLGIILIILEVLHFLKKPASVKGRHVLITGGSSGIGKWCAIEVAKLGANITLLARDKDRLEKAKVEIEASCIDKDKQCVSVISVDISCDCDVEEAIQQAQCELGPISVLINCAGFAIAARLEDTKIEDIQRLLAVNFLGSCYVTRAVLPTMKDNRWGRIVFTSSQAGLLGVYGYTAYSASKFALRGLAETLQMEVKPYNIKVTLAFPPDTDTPGFAEEEKTKPIETRMISETSSLTPPDVVAAIIVKDMLRGKFLSSVGFDGKILTILCAGMSPVSYGFELLTQVFFMGLTRVFAVGLLFHFNRIVAKCRRKSDEDKKEF